MKFRITNVLVLLLLLGGLLFWVQPTFAQETTGHDTMHAPAQGEIHEHAAQAEIHGQESHGDDLGDTLPLWSIIPFIGILLSIAVFPLVAPEIWHHHFGKIAAFWALIFAIPFVIAYQGHAMHEILHIYILDYIPFIILLWALYTASGGILLKGAPAGTPFANLVLLLIGTLIASWIGTTGASMVLIRPLIRMNGYRKSKVHIVIFFIFLVSNIGGALTPLGDPPLFLGFLHHVPFFWTLFNIAPEMFLVSGLLLVIFFVFDVLMYRKEGWHKTGVKSDDRDTGKMRIEGLHNIIFLVGVMAGVLFSGIVKLGHINVFGVHLAYESIIRDSFLVLMGILSIRTTSTAIREGNEFTWFPIAEVAKLFAGIFMTIIPALAMLKAGAGGHLGFITEAVKEPAHYFWVTGALSSFLDNAPTYLTFLNSALGQFFAGIPEATAVGHLISEQAPYLRAISTGAVFFGAMTYIGNAPNFMVKSIAEEQNIKMPSFFGYMLYSVALLIPLFVIAHLVFF